MNAETDVRKIRKKLTDLRDLFVLQWATDGIARDGRQNSELLGKELDDLIRMAYDAGVHDGKNDG